LRLISVLRGRFCHPLYRHFGSVTSGSASLLKLQLRTRHINGSHRAIGRRVAPASWHAGRMSGKEIDRARARSAMDVIRQHPAMVLFAVSPAIAAVAAVWILAGAGWAILLLIALVVVGGAAVLRKR
jgi:hypothetical protein